MNTRDAVCRVKGDPEDWFRGPNTPGTFRAKQACSECPLKAECAAEALDLGIPDGIWGGLDPEQRREIWNRQGGMPRTFVNQIDPFGEIAWAS